MADRYWVGGTGNWSDDDNHWASSSGGSPSNGNLPTSSDDVFIDTNSGFGSGGAITIDVNAVTKNLTSQTGHTYSITYTTFKHIDIYGSFTLESGVTFAPYYADFKSTLAVDINFNGATCNVDISFTGEGTYTLLSNLSCSQFYQENGVVDLNDQDVYCVEAFIYGDTEYTPEFFMGSGTLTVTGTDGWIVEDTDNMGYVVLHAETSTIEMAGTSIYFVSNYATEDPTHGQTYYNLLMSGNSRSLEIYGSNTFNNVSIVGKKTVYFEGSSNQNVRGFIATGTADNIITIASENPSEQFILTKSDGIVRCDYLNLTNSNAAGGAMWYAGSHSIDTANNDGWRFTDAPTSPFPSFFRS